MSGWHVVFCFVEGRRNKFLWANFIQKIPLFYVKPLCPRDSIVQEKGGGMCLYRFLMLLFIYNFIVVLASKDICFFHSGSVDLDANCLAYIVSRMASSVFVSHFIIF